MKCDEVILGQRTEGGAEQALQVSLEIRSDGCPLRLKSDRSDAVCGHVGEAVDSALNYLERHHSRSPEGLRALYTQGSRQLIFRGDELLRASAAAYLATRRSSSGGGGAVCGFTGVWTAASLQQELWDGDRSAACGPILDALALPKLEKYRDEVARTLGALERMVPGKECHWAVSGHEAGVTRQVAEVLGDSCLVMGEPLPGSWLWTEIEIASDHGEQTVEMQAPDLLESALKKLEAGHSVLLSVNGDRERKRMIEHIRTALQAGASTATSLPIPAASSRWLRGATVGRSRLVPLGLKVHLSLHGDEDVPDELRGQRHRDAGEQWIAHVASTGPDGATTATTGLEFRSTGGHRRAVPFRLDEVWQTLAWLRGPMNEAAPMSAQTLFSVVGVSADELVRTRHALNSCDESASLSGLLEGLALYCGGGVALRRFLADALGCSLLDARELIHQTVEALARALETIDAMRVELETEHANGEEADAEAADRAELCEGALRRLHAREEELLASIDGSRGRLRREMAQALERVRTPSINEVRRHVADLRRTGHRDANAALRRAIQDLVVQPIERAALRHLDEASEELNDALRAAVPRVVHLAAADREVIALRQELSRKVVGVGEKCSVAEFEETRSDVLLDRLVVEFATALRESCRDVVEGALRRLLADTADAVRRDVKVYLRDDASGDGSDYRMDVPCSSSLDDLDERRVLLEDTRQELERLLRRQQ